MMAVLPEDELNFSVFHSAMIAKFIANESKVYA